MNENAPTTDVVSEYCQKTTLIKARIQGAVDFLEKKEIKGLNKDVFRANDVSHATGYRILKSSNPRTLVNDPTRKSLEGGKKSLHRSKSGRWR